jgi:hypothetical protein
MANSKDTDGLSRTRAFLNQWGASGQNIVVEHRVSKTLLEDQSPYFRAMFKPNTFQESATGQEDFLELEAIPDVLPEHSLKIVLSWLHGLEILLEENERCQIKDITQMIQVARLADY